MTLQDLGSLGEFVAALATLATLIYLALQIRRNTESVRAATFQEISRSAAELARSIYADADVARLFFQAQDDLDGMDPIERLRTGLLLISFFRHFENLHHQNRMGFVSDEDFAGVSDSYFSAFEPGGLKTWWEENDFRFNRQFREFVGGKLARGDGGPQ